MFRDARAVRGAPAVPDMERPGGIGGDELHLDAPAAPECRVRVARTGGEDAAHHGGERLGGDTEVDEAGSGDVDGRDRVRLRQPCHDALGDLAGLASGDAGEGEGDGTREVAVVVAAAALDRDLRQRIERELPGVAQRRERTLEERSDVLLHWSDALRFAGKMVSTPSRRPEYGEPGTAVPATRGQRILSEHVEL